MATFFTGDTHFGDPRALRFDHRPFATLDEHDAALVERWNAAVGPGDKMTDEQIKSLAEWLAATARRTNARSRLRGQVRRVASPRPDPTRLGRPPRRLCRSPNTNWVWNRVPPGPGPGWKR